MFSRSLQVILSTQTVSRSEVASAALLSYDIFLTFGDEVEFVWLKQWSLAKAMYISARYIPWIIQMVLLTVNVDGTTGLLFKMEDCMKWVIVQAIFLQLTITIVDVILIARVYVLFQRNKPLIGTLISLLFIEIGYMTFVLAHVVSRLTFDENCFVISSPSFFVSYWIVALFYQTLLYTLTLYKFIQHIRSYKGGLRRSFLRCFIEDGTWAFTLIFVTLTLNLMFYKFVHSPLTGIFFTWLFTVLSMSGSRLLLNTRRLAYTWLVVGERSLAPSFSGLRFKYEEFNTIDI